MDGGRRRRAWRWGSATVDPDGYRHYLLRAAGSASNPSTDLIVTICADWFVAEADFVRGLMRRVAGGSREAIDYAAATTALAYFQAVRNGNGMAQFVRAHLDGSNPIREPKGLFIRTVELHRTAALREDRSRRMLATRESSTASEDLTDRVPYHAAEAEPPSEESLNALLEVRADLHALAENPAASATAVQTRLDTLASFCPAEVRSTGMLESLTERQRLVFLLRASPLADVDGLALEYEHISALSAAIGLPTSAEALRQNLRAARQRLRATHTDLLDELRNG